LRRRGISPKSVKLGNLFQLLKLGTLGLACQFSKPADALAKGCVVALRF
jgi:hypothetical protein